MPRQAKYEGITTAGSSGQEKINYLRYGNGTIAHMQYPQGTWVRRDYTYRGELKTLHENGTGNWLQRIVYTYLPDGKVDHQEYGSGVMQTVFGYDGRGMIQTIGHSLPSGTPWSREYWRDDRDRIFAIKKENNRGDRFDYDDEGQLTDGWYDAADPGGNFNGWTRKDHFDYDKVGNRKGIGKPSGQPKFGDAANHLQPQRQRARSIRELVAFGHKI